MNIYNILLLVTFITSFTSCIAPQNSKSSEENDRTPPKEISSLLVGALDTNFGTLGAVNIEINDSTYYSGINFLKATNKQFLIRNNILYMYYTSNNNEYTVSNNYNLNNLVSHLSYTKIDLLTGSLITDISSLGVTTPPLTEEIGAATGVYINSNDKIFLSFVASDKNISHEYTNMVTGFMKVDASLNVDTSYESSGYFKVSNSTNNFLGSPFQFSSIIPDHNHFYFIRDNNHDESCATDFSRYDNQGLLIKSNIFNVCSLTNKRYIDVALGKNALYLMFMNNNLIGDELTIKKIDSTTHQEDSNFGGDGSLSLSGITSKDLSNIKFSEDSEGNIWIGLGTKVFNFDKDGTFIKDFGSNGVIERNKQITDILLIKDTLYLLEDSKFLTALTTSGTLNTSFGENGKIDITTLPAIDIISSDKLIYNDENSLFISGTSSSSNPVIIRLY